MQTGMRVIDIARKANVSAVTIRYYTRMGLLKPSRDSRSCYKIFEDKDYARLLFIRDARALGMSIADVQIILDASRHSRGSHVQVMALVRERLEAVREKIEALKSAECQLTSVVRQWERSPRGAPTGRGIATAIDQWPGKTTQ